MELAVTLKPSRDLKRESILKVAYEAFLEDGFAATSMSSIAAKVGGSKATLYNYFSSKEELFAAVINEKCQDIQTVLFDTDYDASDFGATLTELGTRFVRLLVSDEKIAIYRLITAETGRFPELGRLFYETGPVQTQKSLARFFDDAVSNGDLRPGDTTIMATHFFDIFAGDLHRRRLWNVVYEPLEDALQKHISQAVHIFLSAYGR